MSAVSAVRLGTCFHIEQMMSPWHYEFSIPASIDAPPKADSGDILG